jgi:hypothetical protein
MKRSDKEACALSSARLPISVADEVARRTRCPGPNGCGRVLRIRPTRPRGGNPVATLPIHKANAE